MKEFAIYKGREYEVKWKGITKFGHKAKLAFLDGSKEFWVPIDSIEDPNAIATVMIKKGTNGKPVGSGSTGTASAKKQTQTCYEEHTNNGLEGPDDSIPF